MAKKEIYYDRETHHFVGLTDELIKELESIHIGVDVKRELKKMGLWLLEHKARKGSLQFINRWLSKVPPDPAYCVKFAICEADGPLAKTLKTYLEELWKNREHLFIINSIQKR